MYDGDDFDVIEKDHVDMRRVLRGKGKSRGDFKNADSLLNDKTDFRTEAMKEKFAKMSIVTDIVTVPSSSAAGLAQPCFFNHFAATNVTGFSETLSLAENFLSLGR